MHSFPWIWRSSVSSKRQAWILFISTCLKHSQDLFVTLHSEYSSQHSWSFSVAILLFSPSYQTAIFTLSKRKENIWTVRQNHVREQGARRGLETSCALGGGKIKRERSASKRHFHNCPVSRPWWAKGIGKKAQSFSWMNGKSSPPLPPYSPSSLFLPTHTPLSATAPLLLPPLVAFSRPAKEFFSQNLSTIGMKSASLLPLA